LDSGGGRSPREREAATDSGRMKRLFDTDDRARALMDALYASL
jgi:hypothetical protein